MKPVSDNITRTSHGVTLDDRNKRHNHSSGVLWFTGLPGSGKSTITRELERRLFDEDYNVSVVDNEVIRCGLSSDLDFSHFGRTENVRRAGEVSALFARAGYVVLSGFISPYKSDRDNARKSTGEGFHEIYLSASAEVCAARDPDGQYDLAKQGEIENFTGVSDPYEVPTAPDLILDTDTLSVDDTVDLLVDYVAQNFK